MSERDFRVALVHDLDARLEAAARERDAMREALTKVAEGPVDDGFFLKTLARQALNTPKPINPDGPEAAAVIQAQAARIAELEAGLRPFANYRGSDAYLASNAPDDGVCAATSFRAGDYRQARSLLSEGVRGDCAEDGSVPSASDDRPVTSGWQTIDSAPRDGTVVDLWAHWPEDDDQGFRIADAYWGVESDLYGDIPKPGWIDPAGGYDRPASIECVATHWMQLPAAPPALIPTGGEG